MRTSNVESMAKVPVTLINILVGGIRLLGFISLLSLDQVKVFSGTSSTKSTLNQMFQQERELDFNNGSRYWGLDTVVNTKCFNNAFNHLR